MDADSLKAERKYNAATIVGLKRRIEISQEEIDLLTTRNAAIDAELAPPRQETETPAAAAAPEESAAPAPAAVEPAPAPVEAPQP